MRKIEYPPALRELIAQLRQMPGVGPRSAERIARAAVDAYSLNPDTLQSLGR